MFAKLIKKAYCRKYRKYQVHRLGQCREAPDIFHKHEDSKNPRIYANYTRDLAIYTRARQSAKKADKALVVLVFSGLLSVLSPLVIPVLLVGSIVFIASAVSTLRKHRKLSIETKNDFSESEAGESKPILDAHPLPSKHDVTTGKNITATPNEDVDDDSSIETTSLRQ